MVFSSITKMTGHTFYHQKSSFGVTGKVCLVFSGKELLYSLLICYWSMENHFSEVKKTSNSFTYELHSPESTQHSKPSLPFCRKFYVWVYRMMTQTGDSPMAATKATSPPFKEVGCKNKSQRLKTTLVQKTLVKRMHNYTIWVYFLAPHGIWSLTPAPACASSLLRCLSMIQPSPLQIQMLIHKSNQLQMQSQPLKRNVRNSSLSQPICAPLNHI